MKILILGGTSFFGRDFVELLSKSNDITIASRGVSNPNIFPDYKKIIYDRDNADSCQALRGDNYDVVVDFSCYNLQQLKNTIHNIKYNRYIIISSQAALTDINTLDKDNWLYGYAAGKQACEHYIRNNFNNNIVCIRPPAIYGENDNTGRSKKDKSGTWFWAVDSPWFQKNQRIEPDKHGAVYVRDCSFFVLKYLSNTPINTLMVDVPFGYQPVFN